LEKAERELKRLAAVRRKKPNPQKLASQVGRKLQQLKAHKYFQYQVDEQGQLQYQKNDELIRNEQNLDGLYLLYTDLEAAQCAKEEVLGNYKNLLAVEDAFCQLKTLYGSPSGLSLAFGPGPQSCAALFHRLLAMRQARP
jgi:hypothetical protein